MERATGRAVRQAARAGLLSAVALACATIEAPPGGPPDPNPPVLLSVTPDSGAVLADFDDDVRFDFDEVIAERGLEDLFILSPRHEEIDVSWHRKWVGVKPKDGWRPNVVYQVSMRQGITDLRTNRSDSSQVITFSTGGPIPNTRIAGNTVDWEAGRIAPRSLIEAIRPSDSLTYFTYSDSTGQFALTAVPPGEYQLFATVDQNNNQRRERRESFDSVTITLDSTFTRDFWMFAHDTVGPRVTNLTYVDSQAVEIEYNQSLSLLLPRGDEARVLLLPDSTPVAIETYHWRDTFDSIRTAQADSIRAVEDSLAALADTTAADSAAAVPDSVELVVAPADTTPAPTPGPGLAGRGQAEDPNAPDPAEVARIEELLAQRDPPVRRLILLLGETLQPDARYVVESTVSNLLGATATSLRVLQTPPPPAPPDSTGND